MTELVKTIDGYSCEVYGVSGTRRIKAGTAVPEIEVYEETIKVSTAGTMSIRYKQTFMSIVICPDPEMSEGMTADKVRKLTSFDLVLKVQRNDDVIVPINLHDVMDAEISDEKWRFTISHNETVKNFLAIQEGH